MLIGHDWTTPGLKFHEYFGLSMPGIGIGYVPNQPKKNSNIQQPFKFPPPSTEVLTKRIRFATRFATAEVRNVKTNIIVVPGAVKSVPVDIFSKLQAVPRSLLRPNAGGSPGKKARRNARNVLPWHSKATLR